MFNMIIVDDEISSALELAQLIDYGKYSFEVSGCFEDAESALEFVKNNSVDLVISDIKMGDMSGLELLKIINKNHPHTKVVLISAYRDFEYAKLAISYNAFEYITKPISYTEYIDVLLRVKEVLEKQNENFTDTDEKFSEMLFFDYFNDIITEEVFIQKMRRMNMDYNILNSECSMVELKINNIKSYIENVWIHGSDRLSSAIKNIVPQKMFDCFIFVLSSSEDKTKLIVINPDKSNYEKNLNDIFAYIKNELSVLLCIESDLCELQRCSSVVALKNVFPDSASYLANTIMMHIINKRFDKVSELKSSFFASASLREQQNLCMQLTNSIKQSNAEEVSINAINEIAIRSISNSQTLVMYFDEIIDSFKNQSGENNLEKAIILEAIRYIDANYSKEITLSSAAKHVMLNASYFSNFFKLQTGECFSDFLIKIRMEYAKDMLKNNPSMKIHTVCENVGYKSQPYFYKVFQAYTGYSPSEYRKLGENSAEA